MWQIKKWQNIFYVQLKDVFTHNEIDGLVERFNKEKKQQAVIDGNTIDNSIRNNKIHWVNEKDEENHELYKKVGGVIFTINKDFFEYDLDFLETLQFTQYDVGDFYSHHLDLGANEGYSRKLSFVMQLSDENDYEGGELNIYHDGLRTPFILPKNKGDCVIFPSWLMHEVKPILEGQRFSLVCWANGSKFK